MSDEHTAMSTLRWMFVEVAKKKWQCLAWLGEKQRQEEVQVADLYQSVGILSEQCSARRTNACKVPQEIVTRPIRGFVVVICPIELDLKKQLVE